MTENNGKPMLEELAERAGHLHRRSREDWFKCADLLLQAREECRHGEWRQFLEAAAIPERTARRMVNYARAGVEIGHLAVLDFAEIDALIAAAGRVRKGDWPFAGRVVAEAVAHPEEAEASSDVARFVELEDQLFVVRRDTETQDEKIVDLEERLAIAMESLTPAQQRGYDKLLGLQDEARTANHALRECQQGRKDEEQKIKWLEREIAAAA